MSGFRRRVGVTLAAVALAGVTMGQESCEESAKELQKSTDELEKSTKDLEDVSGENNAKYKDRMKQVEIGMTKQEVRQVMGQRPRDTQVMESGYGKSETWYYGSYQLSFEDGKLDSKLRY